MKKIFNFPACLSLLKEVRGIMKNQITFNIRQNCLLKALAGRQFFCPRQTSLGPAIFKVSQTGFTHAPESHQLLPVDDRWYNRLSVRGSAPHRKESGAVQTVGQRGFTLVEVLVAIFGFGLIIFGLIALVSQIFLSSSQQGNLLAEIDQARKLGLQIVREFRNATYGDNGAYPLDTAGAQQIVFYSNADLTSDIEKVRYFVQNGKLYKGIIKFNGSTYNPAAEQTYVVQNNLANGANPVFYYYNDTYTGSSTQTSLQQPVNVMQVKFVKILLQIYNKAGMKRTNVYNVSTSGTFRNLKTNLGN